MPTRNKHRYAESLPPRNDPDYKKLWYKLRRDEAIRYAHEYYMENREESIKASTKRWQTFYRNSPSFRMAHIIRQRIRAAFKRYVQDEYSKSLSSQELLGVPIEQAVHQLSLIHISEP